MKRILLAALFCAAALFLPHPALAAFEQFEFDTPEQRERYGELTGLLRCLVCQNQTLADSSADLASDLREVVRDMVISGASDEEIIEFMLERYGDFVLFRPPVRGSTYALWAGPFVLMLFALLFLRRLARRGKAAAQPPDPPA